jgi:hypothetical protein
MRISNAKLSIGFDILAKWKALPATNGWLRDHWSHLLSHDASFSFPTGAERCLIYQRAS